MMYINCLCIKFVDKPTVTDENLQGLKDKFVELIHKQYLMRYPVPDEDDSTGTVDVPVLVIKESLLFWPPDINMKCLSLLSTGLQAEDPGDIGVYWRMNFDRFHQDLRYVMKNLILMKIIKIMSLVNGHECTYMVNISSLIQIIFI